MSTESECHTAHPLTPDTPLPGGGAGAAAQWQNLCSACKGPGVETQHRKGRGEDKQTGQQRAETDIGAQVIPSTDDTAR